MKVLFLFPYPSGTAASQRFRFEQYLSFLSEQKIDYTLAPFLNEATWRILYKPGYTAIKISGIVFGFIRRLFLLFSVPQYDFVFIHREASPIGPPVIEWLIAKVFRKKIVFDFDDAIWLPNTSASNWIAARMKWHHKTGMICRWSYKVSAGNAYLAEYAARFNANVVVNPTTIDTLGLHNRVKGQITSDNNSDKLVIGWTGTHSTLFYLHALVPIFQELEKSYPFTLLVISDREPDFTLKSLQFIPWNKENEITDLLRMHVGIMPLSDDQWAKGKCGFKALQYMALGIPALISPVGVNTQIVEDGVNGYLCNTSEEWKQNLIHLLSNDPLRTQMGVAAREKIEQFYSVQANCRTFLGLFTA